MIFPRLPSLIHCRHSLMPVLERDCVPVCTIRLYLRAASTRLRLSQALCDTGFSTYTSFPAWIAQIAASECQWFGVAIETASTFLLSSNRRMSVWPSSSAPRSFHLANSASRTLRSTSHRPVIRTPGTALRPFKWSPPRPWKPTTAMRTSSLGLNCDQERMGEERAPAVRVGLLRNALRLHVFLRDSCDVLQHELSGGCF